MGKEILIGTLGPDGKLRSEAGEILLTKISTEADQRPESLILEIPSQEEGKLAIVKGDRLGDVLHSAEVVEILSPISSALFKSLVEKGIVSSEELRNQIEELEKDKTVNEKPKNLCALVIGHKKSSKGAVNVNHNITEFDFNEAVALRIEKRVKKTDIQRIYRRTYSELPGDVNGLEPDFTVSLHCNAFNGKASGTEVLYYHKSKMGEKIAGILLNNLVGYLKLPNRGIKPRTTEDRGGYLLRYTKAPCVISEPFFIDNDSDLDRARDDIEGLVAAYATAIDEISQVVTVS